MVPSFRMALTPQPLVKYTLPEASAAMPPGCAMFAAAACTPSTEVPKTPVPATVLIVRLVPMRRTRWSPKSATYTFPLPSTATPQGSSNAAPPAGPLSPMAAVRMVPASCFFDAPGTATVKMACCKKSVTASPPAGAGL